LWLQIALALIGVTLVMSVFTGILVRKLETDYLLAHQREQSQHTFSLVSSAVIEAVITEDAPVLDTIAEQLLDSDPNMSSVRIVNEDDVILVSRRNAAIPATASRLRFSQPMVFNGERFGSVEIQWSVEHIHREIEQHVGLMRLALAGALLLLVALIVVMLRGLAVAPVNRIHQGLLALARGGSPEKLALPPYASLELARLAEIVGDLGRHQETLKKSQARLAEAQRVALLGSWDWDIVEGRLHGSDELFRILDTSPQGSYSTYEALFTYVHADDTERVRLAIEGTLTRGTACDADFRLLRSDGIERLVHQHTEAACDGLGRVVRVLGTLQDITERKRAEHALRDSEERFRSIFELSPAGMITVDARGTVNASNRVFQGMLGYGEEELHGMAFASLIDAQDREAMQVRLREWLDGGAVAVGLESRYRRKSGELLWARTSAKGVQGPRGEIRYVFAIVEDITERRLAEDSLRQAAKVFESTTEGVIITDAAVNIVAVNRAFVAVTGYSAEEAIGQNPRLLQSGRHDKQFYAAMWSAIRESGHWQGEVWSRRKNGEVYPQWLNVSKVRNDADVITHYVGVFSDITNIKRSEERLEYLAHHDPLTGLPNRLLLTARIDHAMERARRRQNQIALLFLDVDRFKNINDTLGHPAGDDLLKIVGQRLSDCVRGEDTVARLGGDEFVVVAEDIAEAQGASLIAQRLLEALSRPLDLEGQETAVTASIGIALYPADGGDAKSLLKNADAAMYQAKQQGRNTYQFYQPELTVSTFERFSMEARLRRALERGELFLNYQPQICLKTGRIIGAEALLRWRDPQLGLISPAKFIPLAEETGLIEPIGAWVLQAACAQNKAWQLAGLPALRVAVNVSGYQVERGAIAKTVADALEYAGLDPQYLELEITEGVLVREREQSTENLNALRRLGVTFAIDDFGTGYSSLSYLKRMPIDKLKIDRSFVRDIARNADDAAIARAIVALGHGLQLTVIAEGVETAEQLEILRALDCDEVQGYFYSPPLSVDAFAELLGRSFPLPVGTGDGGYLAAGYPS
jgi:diguanylate cyclase (GGDEF)-like protein/PAS domain S-box-containing protein